MFRVLFQEGLFDRLLREAAEIRFVTSVVGEIGQTVRDLQRKGIDDSWASSDVSWSRRGLFFGSLSVGSTQP